MKKKIKLGIITSKGGHLLQILKLNSLIKKYPHFWVSFKGEDTKKYIAKEKTYIAFYPESRNLYNFIRNLYLALKILLTEKPNALLSSGAGIAVPFFLVGKFLNIKLIYIESYDFVKYPSLTGRIIYKLCDLFLVQHKIQKKWYPNAKYWGSLL